MTNALCMFIVGPLAPFSRGFTAALATMPELATVRHPNVGVLWCVGVALRAMGSWQKNLVSAFRYAIAAVVSVSPKEQMIRSDANGIVAVMQHREPGRNGSVVKNPRESVGSIEARSSVWMVANHEVSITGRHSSAAPFPARVRLSNLSPEAVDASHRSNHSR